MDKIDKKLADVADKGVVEMSVEDIQELIAWTKPDQSQSELVWNPVAVAESLGQLAKLRKEGTGFVYVDRERGLEQKRRETQGIIEGGEQGRLPDAKIGLFMLRTKAGKGRLPAWWPQIRFPDGSYAFAFSV